MNHPATEVDPTFYLLVHIPDSLSVQQVQALRKAGPEGESNVPAHQFLANIRAQKNVSLGPYWRKYLAERAKSELVGAGLTVEMQTK